jgi:hypothetical protein
MTLKGLTSGVLNVLTYVIVGVAFLVIARLFRRRRDGDRRPRRLDDPHVDCPGLIVLLWLLFSR